MINLISIMYDKLDNIKNIEQNDMISIIILLFSLYLYTNQPITIVKLISHPIFIMLLIYFVYFEFQEKNYNLSVSLSILIIISLILKKQADVKELVITYLSNKSKNNKIIEKFSDENSEDLESIENNSDDDVNSNDIVSKTVDSDSELPFMVNYNTDNLNDTFKNLHDAIHQLEKFMSKSKKDNKK